MTALMPRTGGNKTYIIVDRDRNHSEYPSSPQERGGPCYISIQNGNNTQYKARHSVSVQRMKATKTREQKAFWVRWGDWSVLSRGQREVD